jgi:hypothetical protein
MKIVQLISAKQMKLNWTLVQPPLSHLFPSSILPNIISSASDKNSKIAPKENILSFSQDLTLVPITIRNLSKKFHIFSEKLPIMEIKLKMN